MNNQDKAKLVEELDELYAQLQRHAVMLNRRLAQAHESSSLRQEPLYSSPSEEPDPLSQVFTDLLVRYKQAQQRYAQLSGPSQGIKVSEGVP
ncbi:hypothetical protein [Spirosoma aerophilum]